MEITRKNFDLVFPTVKEALEQCDFLAIDTELTGLYSEESYEHAFDSMEERYAKLRKLCSDFLIIQFGISLFKYHPKLKKYTHRDYNFYVFPHPHIRQAPDNRFLCQTSSLHFLASHGFDFNKTIYEGITYLRYDEEEKLRDCISKKYKVQRSKISTPKKCISEFNSQSEVPDEHKKFIAEIHERVNSFIANDLEKTMTLEPCSSYRRKLIYETVQVKHQSGIELSSTVNENKERFITITKSSDNEKLKKIELGETCDMDDVDAAIGFRRVIELISQSKKLVIGHNMYLDILHTIHKFLYPLPESLQEYKKMLNLVFPSLLDTKHLASSDKLRPFLDSTALGEISKSMQGIAFDLPEIEVEEGFQGYKLSSENYHEAGFDAFLTATCFIGLSKKLGSLQSEKVELLDSSSKIINPFINRFHVMRHYDTPFLNLCEPDAEPLRDNVFYVSFPREWETVDLVELFLPYGEIFVHWLNDVSALVALKNPENIIRAKAALINKFNKMYCVQSYKEYQKRSTQLIVKENEIKKASLPVIPGSAVTKNSNKAAEHDASMELISETEENEAEETDQGKPPAKKLKKLCDDPESGEITSTFEEPNKW